jgi:hypothetical protein
MRGSESRRHKILIRVLLATKILSGYQILKKIGPCSHLHCVFGDRYFHPQAESRRTEEKRGPLKAELQENLGKRNNHVRPRLSSGRYKSNFTMHLHAVCGQFV